MKERNFIHSFSYSFFHWEGCRGSRSLNNSRFSSNSVILQPPHQDRVNANVFTPPGPWTTSWPLSRGWTSRTCLAILFWDIPDKLPNQSNRALYFRTSGSTFRALRIPLQRTLSQSVTAQKSNLCRLYLG